MARTPKWDKEIVELAARVKFIRAEHVANRFGMTVRNANMRLKRLAEVGLLRIENRLPGGRLFAATKDGIESACLDLAPPRFSYGSIEHDLAIAEFVIACESHGYPCLAERELVAEERASEDRRFVFSYMQHGCLAEHVPDAAFLGRTRDEFVAVEFELSNKSLLRTRTILRSYKGAIDYRGLRGVLYLVGAECSPRTIHRQIKEGKMEDCAIVTVNRGVVPVEELRALFKMAHRRHDESRRVQAARALLKNTQHRPR